MKKALLFIAAIASMLIAATVDFTEVTVIGTLQCGATTCEDFPGGWVNYWIDTPGCAKSRLYIKSDELSQFDCKHTGETITARGYIEQGDSGCYVLQVRELNQCYPVPGVTDCISVGGNTIP